MSSQVLPFFVLYSILYLQGLLLHYQCASIVYPSQGGGIRPLTAALSRTNQEGKNKMFQNQRIDVKKGICYTEISQYFVLFRRF